jgi:hypothetical protein
MIRPKIKKFVNNQHYKKKLFTTIAFLLFLGISLNFFTFSNMLSNYKISYTKEKPKMAWFWATLDLTNPGEVNNSLFTHYESISVRGRLYNKIDGSNKSFINVAIEVDDIVDMSYTDITDGNGQFDINYIIDGFLDVYSSHKIEVVVTDTEPGGPGSEIEYHDFYNIYVNATSDFFISSSDNLAIPKLTEENFNFDVNLRYDNGQGIPFANVNYYWLDGSTIVSQGFIPTDGSGYLGSGSLQIPITSASYLTLKFNYSNSPFISYSEESFLDIAIFSDVAWNLNIINPTTEGVMYTLTGTLSSSTDFSVKIANRALDIYFNGTLVDTVTTNSIGAFTSNFRIPIGNGTVPIYIELDNSAGKLISSPVQFILVENAPPPIGGGAGLPPFVMFSLIFFPILIAVVVGLAVYGFFFYKKQEEESRVVNIQLESKIKNLKILKDSGRLEESLSYLFNAIYMDLVNAKYNRIRKENETIRDFAIVSVKELKLTPSSIYPFIQQVEEIIYGKPYKITEADFYKICELFSPIYFQLTGSNFILNF